MRIGEQAGGARVRRATRPGRALGRGLPIVLLMTLDLALLHFGVALVLRGLDLIGQLYRVNVEAYVDAAPFMTLLWAVALLGLDVYRPTAGTVRSATARVARAFIVLWVLSVANAFWLRAFAFPRSVLGLGLAVGVTLVITRAILTERWAARRAGGTRIAVVCADDALDDDLRLVRNLREGGAARRPLHVRAVAASRSPGSILDEVDLVLLAPGVDPERRERWTRDALDSSTGVLVSPTLTEMLLTAGVTGDFHGLPVVEIPALRPPALAVAAKRIVDAVGALTALILLAPLFAVVAVLIRRDSPGPALFRQTRVGRDGQTFEIVKFRTMCDDAEATTGPVLATDHDPRVTSLGRLLRSTRIDELPQLWNVVRGDMSLVGPRPERPVFVESFRREVEGYDHRHVVRPGMTGLAQVSAGYAASAEEKLRYDLAYIRKLGMATDLRLILQTMTTVLDRSAARGTTAVDDVIDLDRDPRPDLDQAPVELRSPDHLTDDAGVAR